MSKLLAVLFSLFLLGLIGGFVYLAIVDVPIAQSPVENTTTLDVLRAGEAAQ